MEELFGRVVDNVEGFYERFFARRTKDGPVGRCHERYPILYGSSRWKDWPDPPIQDAFMKWFRGLQESMLSDLPQQFYT